MPENDQVVWESIRNGNVDSLKLLHERYYFQLCHYVNRFLKDMTVSEELVSDCFVKLWLHRDQIFIQKSVKAYLYFMVRNRMINYSNKRKRDLVQHTNLLPDCPADEEMNKLDFYAELYRAIKLLPEQRRKILELAAFGALSYSEIASQLNISVNTVKTQMGRAYQFLKEELDPRSFYLFFLSGRKLRFL
ncbi:MAG: RNA polymerase sigma-70 factor [Prolixibacteraceae bacterium]